MNLPKVAFFTFLHNILIVKLKRSKRDKSKQKSNVCRAPLTKIRVRTSFSQATYFKGKVKSGRAKNDVSDSLLHVIHGFERGF